VVTQPDRPKGRGLELVAFARQAVRPAVQDCRSPSPTKSRTNDDFRAQLTALKPDAIVVVGYGRIIPQWMLDLPPLGNINLHASLLAEISRRRAHSVGDRPRRNRHRRYHDENRRRPRHR
jgi:methionyl-tRNA formyltransferase